MRKKIVAGNWKMNTTLQEGVELAKAVAAKSVETPENVGLIVAPPFTHLASVAEALKGSKVELSAQNCADHEKGAYTGEAASGPSSDTQREGSTTARLTRSSSRRQSSLSPPVLV